MTRSSGFRVRRVGRPQTPNPELSAPAPQLIDIIEIPKDKPYQNFDVLHQKYVVERATIAQIARSLLCSKSAIQAALTRAGIPIRRRGQLGFTSVKYGVKHVKGRRVGDQTEQKVINTIIELRNDGMSYDKIASFLTKMGVPTKTRRRKWNGGCVRSIYLTHKTPDAP